MASRVEPGHVLWLTGLSGAGKSTIATAVVGRLEAMNIAVEYLDGDAVRQFSPAGYTREERDAHVKRVGFLASRLSAHGITVVCALISPYRSVRDDVRRMCSRFVEIYISTPIAECERRDPKGLYAKARRGEITQFTGISDPYEPPECPDLEVDASSVSATYAAQLIVAAALKSRSGGSQAA